MKHVLVKGLTGFLAAALLLVTGCQIVHVTDQQGNPIFWADVSASTQESGSVGMPVKTDAMGNATLAMSQEAPGTREWLEVSKDGYMTRRIVRPEDGTVEVQLLKAPSATNSQDAQAR